MKYPLIRSRAGWRTSRWLLLAIISVTGTRASAKDAPTTGQSSTRPVPIYLRGLDDANPLNRAAMARAIGREGPVTAEVRAALTEAMTDGDRNVRVAAARSIHSLWPEPNETVERVLCEAVLNGAFPAQRLSIEALTDFPSERSAAALDSARADYDPSIRQFARDALVALGPIGRERLSRPAKPGVVLPNLVERPATAEEPETLEMSIRRGLASKDSELRLAAVKRIGSVRASFNVLLPELRSAVKDADPAVRAAAVLCLLDNRAEPDASMAIPLCELLAWPEPAKRLKAMKALEVVRDPSTVPALVKALDDSEPEIRLGGARTLGQLGPDAAKTAQARLLNMYLNGEDSLELSHAAAAALVQFPEGEAVVAKHAIDDLPSKNELRRAKAVDDLRLVRREATKPAIHILIDLLRAEPNDVRVKAMELLGALGPDAAEAIPSLTAIVDNAKPDLRRAAANALIQVDPGGPHLERALLAAVLHNDRAVSEDLLSAVSSGDRSDTILAQLDEISRTDPNAGVRARATDVAHVWAARFTRKPAQ